MPSQTEAGKAFEYALSKEIFNSFSLNQNVKIIQTSSYTIAQNCFNLFSDNELLKYKKAADAAIHHILQLEPNLDKPLTPSNNLNIKVVSDSEGIKGDVRDVIVSRENQNWEIGISAKNNHKAVKHSRLSSNIDFGKEWLALNCSKEYFNLITPIFSELLQLKNEGKFWRNIENKYARFYIPILNAFKNELVRLDGEYPSIVPQNLLRYLIGNNDFYKVIKRKNKTEIYGFHLYGTLNKSTSSRKATFKVPRLKLPTRIIEITYKQNSNNTLILTCDEGWQVSFRIHNASSKVEPSLKFDINLIGQPQALYSHHISWQ
ncbi:MAG: HaeIII family restriction endonuclease [Agriterribacter sp.]